jgi:hypothetical protein
MQFVPSIVAGLSRSNAGGRKNSRRALRRRARCCLEALETRVLLSTVSWTASGSGSWNTTTNWSTNNVPQPGDDVVISKSGNLQVTLAGSASVNSISVSGGDILSMSGGTLSVAANSTISPSSSLLLSNSTLTLAAGATLTNSGSITVNPLSSLNVGAAYTQTATGSLTLPSGSLVTGVGSNLLGNGGFESPFPKTSMTTPDVWGDWGPSYINTQYAHTGLQSVLTPGTSGGSGVNQAFSATPGVSYTLSVYAMTPTTSKLTGAEEGILNLTFNDASGNQVGSHAITVLTANSAAGGPNSGSVGNQGWNSYATSGVAPSGAVTAYVALQVGPYSGLSGTNGGSVLWDDAQFGPTAATSAAVNVGSLSNSGAITIGASARINAATTFSQTSTGTLTVQLGAPAASLLYGTLTAGGAATFGGTFKAVLVNGYSPTLSDSFTLLNYASQTGAFSSTQLPSGASYAFQPGVNLQYMGISALPTSLTTAVNIASVIGSASKNLVGVNLAYWDDQLTTSQTQSLVQAAGLNLFRFPGGSSSDDYHFNVAANYGDPVANTIPQFAQLIENVGGAGIVTLDYGSGSPQEAEAELAYLLGSPSDTTAIGTGMEWNDATSAWQNVDWHTVGYWASLRAATPITPTDDGYNFLRIGHANPFTEINDWEIGNEQYGNWEIDHYSPTGLGDNSTSPYNYPAAYAQFAATFAAFATADKNLPAIQVGIDSGDPTGASDNNWTRNVLTDGLADGFVPGFISDHSYMYGPGAESDSVLLNNTVSNPLSIDDWSTRHSDYESILQATLGASASSVQIMATEYNSNYGTPGKQMVSLVNGLFVADSIGSLLDSGYTGGSFWDLRNGWGTDGNNSPNLYGWRQGGDEGILGDPNIINDMPSTGPYVPYPNYFGEQLASKIIKTGGTVVSAASNYNELAVYSVLEANGHLELMVINKNPDATINEQFNLQGFTPTGQAQFWQYGEPQDYAQSQTSNGAASLANFSTALSFTGNSFNYAFAAYSMTVIDLTPLLSLATAAAATPNPVVGAAVALSALASENGSGNGLTYLWSAAGPASVTYTAAANGTNAAKNITANFTQVGIYNFTVTITDTGGQTTNSFVQVIVLPVFASQMGTTLTITLNTIAPLSVATSGNSIIVNEAGYQYTFTGVNAVTVNGAATTGVLNFTGPLTSPFTFINSASSTLNVNSGTLTFAANAGAAIELGTLSVTGRLDVTNDDLIVHKGDLGTITSALKAGFNAGNGYWNGTTGIISTAAAGDTRYLTTLASRQGDGTPFDGINTTTSDVLVKYTDYGDADLNGSVDGADYHQIDNGFGSHLTGWGNGDFNYDGIIDGSDYALIDNAFNQISATSTPQIAQPTAILAAKAALPQKPKSPPAGAQAAVPSPFSGTSIALRSDAGALIDLAADDPRKHSNLMGK